MDHSSDIFVFVWIHLTDYWNGMTTQMFLLRIQGVHVHDLASACGGLRFRHKRFYRAMLCIGDTSHGPVSMSVCHKSEFY